MGLAVAKGTLLQGRLTRQFRKWKEFQVAAAAPLTKSFLFRLLEYGHFSTAFSELP